MVVAVMMAAAAAVVVVDETARIPKRLTRLTIDLETSEMNEFYTWHKSYTFPNVKAQ